MVLRPLVTVVTPTYNRGHLLPECTHSLIDQTYTNWEHLIIDDASIDGTAELLQNSLDPRIRSYRNEQNIGVVRSYKLGFEKAKGDIICLQDSDDLSLPDRLEKVVRKFQETDADVVYHGIYNVARRNDIPIEIRTYKGVDAYSLERLKKEQYIPGVICLKKSAAQLFTPDTLAFGCWDWNFLLQLAFAGLKFEHINEGLYLYRRHTDALSVQNEDTGKRKKSISYIRRWIKTH